MKRLLLLPILLSLWGCASLPSLPLPRSKTTRSAEADLATLRRQLEDIYGNRDVAAFGALHTDGVVYEWRGRRTADLTGRAALENSQRELWANRRELRLSLQAATLRIQTEDAYESGSYEETWVDPLGSRITEFGRYTMNYVREGDGQWRSSRRSGFSDVTATSRATE